MRILTSPYPSTMQPTYSQLIRNGEPVVPVVYCLPSNASRVGFSGVLIPIVGWAFGFISENKTKKKSTAERA